MWWRCHASACWAQVHLDTQLIHMSVNILNRHAPNNTKKASFCKTYLYGQCDDLPWRWHRAHFHTLAFESRGLCLQTGLLLGQRFSSWRLTQKISWSSFSFCFLSFPWPDRLYALLHKHKVGPMAKSATFACRTWLWQLQSLSVLMLALPVWWNYLKDSKRERKNKILLNIMVTLFWVTQNQQRFCLA